MPLEISEEAAVILAVDAMRLNDGSPKGVQQFIRGLGAHAEQAKRITALAEEMYGTIQPFMGEGDSPSVQASVELEGKEMNITLKADRLPITTFEELVEFYDIDTDVWRPESQVFNFWGSKENPNFQVKARFARDDYQAASAGDREALRQLMAIEAPEWRYREPLYGESGELMFELVVSDLHVEKYDGTPGSLDRMLDELERACIHIIDEVHGEVSQVHLVFNGDTFNSDNAKGTTTKGTPQENVQGWREVFAKTRERIAKIAYAAHLSFSAPVQIHILAGNHDYERSYYLADSLWAFFNKHPDISVSLGDGLREYIRWGSTLIGLAHGNDIKPIDLVMSMFREQDTTGVRFPVWHLGHYHTRREDEIHGVLVRGFRTAQTTGEWDRSKGYGHNQRDIVGIVHHKTKGDIAEYRYSFDAHGDEE